MLPYNLRAHFRQFVAVAAVSSYWLVVIVRHTAINNIIVGAINVDGLLNCLFHVCLSPRGMTVPRDVAA